jgi:calmodulin
MERGQQTSALLARARFDELDADKNGFLENKEIEKVVQWVMESYGNKIGSDPEVVKSKMMQRLDANKDGKLDPEEFQILFMSVVQRLGLMQRAEAKFKEFDTDNSVFLENKEIDAFIDWTLQAFPEGEDYSSYKEKLMKEIDANGDGKLDLGEFKILFEDMLARIELVKRAKVKFDELDTDKSGMLEAAELDIVCDWVLTAYVEKSEAERAEFKTTLMKKIDANGDGKLSLPEFAVLWDEMLVRMDLIKRASVAFKKLDVDNSGFLEKEELIPVVKKWAETCNQEIGLDASAQLDAMISATDANSDGKIDLMEFIPIFQKCIQDAGIWN